MKNNENGNIIFILLVVIILFVGLSYTVMNSPSVGGNDSSSENTRLQVDRLLNYVSLLTATVTRLKNTGCGDNEISFENSLYPTATNNPRAPSNFRCHVYHPDGGGVPYILWNDKFIEQDVEAHQGPAEPYKGHNSFIGTSRVSGVGIEGDAEIVLVIPWLKDSVCESLRERFGTTETTGGAWSFDHLGPFQIREPPDPMDVLNNFASCETYNGSDAAFVGVNTFYTVLMMR